MVSNIFYFHPYLGKIPIWLIFFRWVETTSQKMKKFTAGYVWQKIKRTSKSTSLRIRWRESGAVFVGSIFKGGGNSIFCKDIFSPWFFGEMIQIDWHIFQMGWNHHLVNDNHVLIQLFPKPEWNLHRNSWEQTYLLAGLMTSGRLFLDVGPWIVRWNFSDLTMVVVSWVRVYWGIFCSGIPPLFFISCFLVLGF